MNVTQFGVINLSPTNSTNKIQPFEKQIVKVGAIRVNNNFKGSETVPILYPTYDYYRAAAGVYNFGTSGANTTSEEDGQRIYIDKEIDVRVNMNAHSKLTETSEMFSVVTVAAGVINRAGNQVIESTNTDYDAAYDRVKGTDIYVDVLNNPDYPRYSILVFPKYLYSPSAGDKNRTLDPWTKTTLKGSFNVNKGDIFVVALDGRTNEPTEIGLSLNAKVIDSGPSEGKLANRLTLANGVNLVVTNSRYWNGNEEATDSFNKYYLELVGTEDGHPYEIRFAGPDSFIDIRGENTFYRGNGEIIFGSNFNYLGSDKWINRSDLVEPTKQKYLDELLQQYKEADSEGKEKLESIAAFTKGSDGKDLVILKSTEHLDNLIDIAFEEAKYGKDLYVRDDEGNIIGRNSMKELQVNGLEVNKNRVFIEEVRKQVYWDEEEWEYKEGDNSVLNLRVDLTGIREQIDKQMAAQNIQYGSESEAVKSYFESNAIYILRQAANNVFIKNWDDSDKSLLPTDDTLNISDGEGNNNLAEKRPEDQFQENVEIGNLPPPEEREPEEEKYEGVDSEGRQVEITTTYTPTTIQTEINRFTGQNPNSENSKRIVAGRVSMTIPEGIITPERTYHTEYYIENKEKYAEGNAYQYNDNKLVDDRILDSLGYLRNDIELPDNQSVIALSDEEEPEKKTPLAEEAGLNNMGEVFGWVSYDENDVKTVVKTTSTMDGVDSNSLTNYFLWRIDNETLYQRLGEVRDHSNLQGLWVRGIYGKDKYSRGGAYFKNRYYGIQLGFDRADENYREAPELCDDDENALLCPRKYSKWIYGGGLTYIDNNIKLANHGSGDSYVGVISAYGTRLFENGMYVDLIAKVSRFSNKFTAISNQARYITKGEYKAYAAQGSIETGRKHMLNNHWYLDPQLQLTVGYMWGTHYRTENALNVSAKGMTSVIGRAGIGLGYESNKGSAFIKVDGLREFTAKYKAKYKLDHGATNSSEYSLKDTWGEIVVGGTRNISKSTYGFIQAKRTFAAKLQTEYRFDAGIRWIF